MGVKYVKDFSFPSSGGFHGDVQRYAKGGHVTKMPAKAKASAKDMPARAKPNAPAKGAPKMASKPAVGKRQGYDKGGRVPGREMDRLPTKRPPGRMKDLAPARRFKGDYQGYAEGGPVAEILPGDGMAPPSPMTPMPFKNFVMPPPGKGPDMGYKGGLEFVMPPPGKGPDVGGYPPPPPPNDFLRQLIERDTQRMRGDAAQQMRDISALEAAPPKQVGGEIPVGALTPLPEEPNYVGPAPRALDMIQVDDMIMTREDAERMRPNVFGPSDGTRRRLNQGPAAIELPAPIEPGAGGSGVRSGTGSLRDLAAGLGPMMPGAPVSRPPIAGEPGFGTSKGLRSPDSDALRRQMAAVKSGMDLQGTRGVKGSPLAEAARRAAVQGRAGMREDTRRAPAMSSRNILGMLLRALSSRSKAPTSRMKAPAPVSRMRSEVLPANPAALPAFKKGGEVKGKKIAKVMGEFKRGELHSGSKKGPVVKNPKQAMAIALSEANASKKAKGGIFSDEYMAYESKGPKTRGTARKGREQGRKDRMERLALEKMRRAEKYAPGLSLDMSEYKKGGKVKHSDVKMDKAMVKKAVHKHERAMHPGKPMTKLKHGGVPTHGRKPMYGGGKC